MSGLMHIMWGAGGEDAVQDLEILCHIRSSWTNNHGKALLRDSQGCSHDMVPSSWLFSLNSFSFNYHCCSDPTLGKKKKKKSSVMMETHIFCEFSWAFSKSPTNLLGVNPNYELALLIWYQKLCGLPEAWEAPGKVSFHTFCYLWSFLIDSYQPLLEVRHCARWALTWLVQLFWELYWFFCLLFF